MSVDSLPVPPGGHGSGLRHNLSGVKDSIYFGRDPIEFCSAKSQKHGPIFQSRLINRDTCVATSGESVEQILGAPEGQYRYRFVDAVAVALGCSLLSLILLLPLLLPPSLPLQQPRRPRASHGQPPR